MSHQDKLGHNGTEPTRSTQPDDDDDGVQRKAETVSHAQDPTKRESLGIHATCGIRHPQVPKPKFWTVESSKNRSGGVAAKTFNRILAD